MPSLPPSLPPSISPPPLLPLSLPSALQVRRRFSSRLPWLQLHLSHAEPSVRDAFARLLALSACQLAASEADSTARQLLDKSKGSGKAVR